MSIHKEILVAQAFQPVLAQAKACGDIFHFPLSREGKIHAGHYWVQGGFHDNPLKIPLNPPFFKGGLKHS